MTFIEDVAEAIKTMNGIENVSLTWRQIPYAGTALDRFIPDILINTEDATYVVTVSELTR